MDEREKAFQKRLLLTFKVEATEHIQALSSGLIALERAAAADTRLDIVEVVFREAHSLKGAARAVGLAEIEAICQALESVFAALNRDQITPTPASFDVLHQATDVLSALLAAAEMGRTAADRSQITTLLQRLEGTLQGGRGREAESRDSATIPGPETPFLPPPPLASSSVLVDTVRIPTVKLDALLLQAEELVLAKLTTRQRLTELQAMSPALATWQRERAEMRHAAGALQRSLERAVGQNGQSAFPNGRENIAAQLTHLLDLLERNDSHIRSFDSALTTLARAAESDQRALGRMVDDLQEHVKRFAMLPFWSLLEIVPKLVRDLGRDRGKEVDVVTQGGDIEIDRRILEEMKDPLIHVVRNCIDHGIEAPPERERQHKQRRGTITIAIAPQDGDKVALLVSDNGAGIDVARVKSVAQEYGLVTPDEAEALNEAEALALVFHSGVSTSPTITEISGRGLGLAIVREKVEKLGGVVSVETAPAVGTMFRMVFPLTLATLQGVLVRVAEHLFVLPTLYVERVLRFNQADVKTVENRDTLQLDGHAIALARLAEALELPPSHIPGPTDDRIPAVVLAAAGQRIAFRVDAVLDEQEVLVKRLGPPLQRVRNIAGATVLGTGQVVPVLNVLDVLKSAVRASAAAATPGAAPVGPKDAGRKSVLVVEDSVTARMLLKNLLEAAGYYVRTAIDGVDGLTQLHSGAVDVVISDVDMPRMNGFTLTEKIRADQKLAAVPVVLVSGLDSPADRERGIEVGANAYLVKGSFDQSNLVAVIQGLI